MAVVKNLMVRCGADFSGLTKATKKAQTSMSAMQKSASALKSAMGAIGIALSAAAIVGFGKSCVEAASDLQEVQNVVDVTFGSMSDQINTFASNAIESFGLSEKSAKQYTGTMGSMLKSMGLSTSAAAGMSVEIAGLAGDLASFYNLSADDAFAKIRSGISGETEPLKQLGINMSVANLSAYALSQGIGKAYSSMTQAEQATLRYNYLMSTTADAQGDFARTSGSWANQTRILSERFNQLKTALGQGLIQALTPVLSVLNTLMAKLVALANTFNSVTAAIFGKQTAAASANADATTDAADAQESLADGVTSASKAAKAAVAGFDDLNVLQTGGDSGSTATDGLLATEQLGTAGLTGEIGADATVSPNLMSAIDTVKAAFQALKENVIAPIFAPLKEYALPMLKEFADQVWQTLQVVADEVATLFMSIYDGGIKPFCDLLLKIWEGIWQTLSEFWGKHGQPIFDGIRGAFQSVADIWTSIWENFLKPVWENFMDTIDWLWTNHLQPFIEKFLNFVGVLIEAALDIYNGVIAPVVNWLVDILGPVFASVFNGILDVVGTIVAGIIDVIGGIIEVLTGVIQFVGGVFKGDWEQAWEGIKTIFKGVWDTFYGIVRVPINLIIDGINTAAKCIVSAFSGVVNAVVGVINGMIATALIPFNLLIDAANKVPGVDVPKLEFSIPSLPNLSASVPDIPKLATGGIATSSTLANIGEAGKEAVLPLENNTGWMDMLADKIGATNVVINAKEKAGMMRYISFEVEKAQRQRGTSLVNGGV